MKRLWIMMMALLLVACGTNTKSENDKKTIVTTSFIGYDLASNIAGDKMEITNIMPWGSELHDFEPTAKDISKIRDADLFIYLSVELEPWVNTNAENENALNLSKSYTLEEHDHEEHEDEAHEDADGHDHATLHFWTDPTNYLQLIEKTKEELIQLDPENKAYYEERAEAYYSRIEQLHDDFDDYTETLRDENRTIYFAGHNAMSAFGERYDLTIVSLSDEYRPDADLTAQQLTGLKEQLTSHDMHYLFTEELVEPRVANQIQASLKTEDFEVTILELNGYHNISKAQYEEGVTYADLFQKNINNIQRALGTSSK